MEDNFELMMFLMTHQVLVHTIISADNIKQINFCMDKYQSLFSSELFLHQTAIQVQLKIVHRGCQNNIFNDLDLITTNYGFVKGKNFLPCTLYFC